MRMNGIWSAIKEMGRIPSYIRRLSTLSELGIANLYIARALSETAAGLNLDPRVPRLTVSLTTYGGRINTVYIAIESLFLQTFPADNIVLWLSRDEFTPEQLPDTLRRQRDRGLTIRFCENIGPYKKLVPALREYGDDCIVTVDDDFVYPPDHLERLYSAWTREPEYIHCHRAHLITLRRNGKLRPYRFWDHETSLTDPSERLFPTGGAGALYFPGSFDHDVSRADLFMRICPDADDVWFKFMSLKKGTLSKLLSGGGGFPLCSGIPGTQDRTLFSTNYKNNDLQIAALLRHYPDIRVK